jgi:hypothetical protein
MLKERAQKVVSIIVHNYFFYTSVLVPRPFEVEVFVSGYAISYRPPENISRSQKAFIRLAKGLDVIPTLLYLLIYLVQPLRPSQSL